MKALQIFKAGRHTALNGAVIDFSAADLEACAAAYDPALREAPLVVGHPKTDAPAYGWVKALAFAEGVLAAVPDQVEAQFAEMVNAGRFKKISAAFYTPAAAGNPKPGIYYLKHVGFLGANAPSVQGLKNASFAGDDSGVVEFTDWNTQTTASLFRRIRDFLIGEFGLEKADTVIPDYQITSLEQSAMQPADSGLSYAERHEEEQLMKTQKELDDQAAALKAQEEEHKRKIAEFAERDKALKASEAAQRRAAIAGEVDALVAAGKILPVHKDGLVAFMTTLPADGVVEFGEGDKKISKPSGAWLREFLAALPKQVEFREVGAGDVEARTVAFAAPPGYTVDPERLELHSQALAYQHKHPGTSYDAAVKAVNH